jgi:hypothetical protein
VGPPEGFHFNIWYVIYINDMQIPGWWDLQKDLRDEETEERKRQMEAEQKSLSDDEAAYNAGISRTKEGAHGSVKPARFAKRPGNRPDDGMATVSYAQCVENRNRRTACRARTETDPYSKTFINMRDLIPKH